MRWQVQKSQCCHKRMLNDENDIKQLQRTLDLLDEDDDVQYVYHNWDE
mgnify:CR=1 FL=1